MTPIYLALQIVDVQYGKVSRGGVGAQARARLPLALELPPGSGRGVLHQCSFTEWTGFTPRFALEEVPLRSDGSLVVQTQWQIDVLPDAVRLSRHLGRGVRGPELALLAFGQRARLRWNTIEASHDVSWYHEATINLGGFVTAPASDVFLGEPDVLVDLRRDLLRQSRRKIRPRP